MPAPTTQPALSRATAVAPAAVAASRWQLRACAVALLVATTVAFLPAFTADFIRWDDPEYVTNNGLLQDAAGLAEIWNPYSRKLPQYYPLVFSSYWLEHHLWQLAPSGYHATNVVLHAINGLLVVLLVRALGASLWVAVGAAAVFLLHPVQVESVVWVTERKNTLSGLLYLLAFLFYLRHRRTRLWGVYAMSLLAFVGALLSKTQTATLPVMIVFTDWLLQRAGRIPRLSFSKIATRVTPMLGLALGATMVTATVERRMAYWFQLPNWSQRIFIATTAPWYYLRTFLVPISLAPIVPRWMIAPDRPQWWIGPLAVAALVVLALRFRPRISVREFHIPLWGLAQFVISLAPVLGVVQFAYQHYSYVANRFLYLSCIGGGVVLASLAERLAGEVRGGARRTAVTAAGVVLLAVCSVLTFREARHWQNTLTFWTYALERNPGSYSANINLGLYYESKQQSAQALPFYQRAHELSRNDSYGLQSYLRTLSVVRGPQAVIEACNDEPKGDHDPVGYVAYLFRGLSYETLGRRREALADYMQVLRLVRPDTVAGQQATQGRERMQRALGP